MDSLVVPVPESSSSPLSAASSSSSLPRLTATPPSASHSPSSSAPFIPYTDDPNADPEAGYPSQESTLLAQRQLMNEQDVHLDSLSQSIGRQHHLSLQINDELDVHTGLLQGLDEELDGTQRRLSGARRGLGRVARGAKENGE